MREAWPPKIFIISIGLVKKYNNFYLVKKYPNNNNDSNPRVCVWFKVIHGYFWVSGVLKRLHSHVDTIYKNYFRVLFILCSKIYVTSQFYIFISRLPKNVLKGENILFLWEYLRIECNYQ